MPIADAWHRAVTQFEGEALRPDLGRGIRASVGLMLPVLLARAGWLPVEAAFAAIAAQSMALVDVRGAYSFRLAFFLLMACVLVGSAALGQLVSDSLGWSLAATTLIALNAGIWRHLSPEYGPSLGTPAGLIFFMALAIPGPQNHALGVAAGGAIGLSLQVSLWPVRPQHPIRRAVAESWLAVADLFAGASPCDAAAPRQRADREARAREVLDGTYAALAAARLGRAPAVLGRLEALHVGAARLATRVSALVSEMEALLPGRGDCGALGPPFGAVLESLANLARAVALATVSRLPAHLSAVEVRLRRADGLLRAVRASVASAVGASAAGAVNDILDEIRAHLAPVGAALSAVTERSAERAAFSMEVLDLNRRLLRPLASALNLTPRVDPAIVRYTAHIGTITLLGVLAFKTHHWAHGYWLPFTSVVVLQPDYGATRQKAAQRMSGTLVGSLLASGLLWMHLPGYAALAGTAAASFLFAYFLKRRYAVAVVFVTFMVVLLTEAREPVTIGLTEERLGCTLAGGGLALAAALLFWPAWERTRLGPILASALEANRDYLRVLAGGLARGGTYGADAVAAKRRAETANREAFGSLRRLIADPASRREGTEHLAAMANGNQRLTRALNLLLVRRTAAAPPVAGTELGEFVERASVALDLLASAARVAAERDDDDDPAGEATAAVAAAGEALDAVPLPILGVGAEGGAATWQQDRVFTQLSRAHTEISAMLMALQPLTPAAENAKAR